LRDLARRRNTIIQTALKIRILAGLQPHASAAEVCVGADFPYAIAHDDGFRAIIELGSVEVGRGSVKCHPSALESGLFVQDDFTGQRRRCGEPESGGDCESCH
jgi:hypothetical protein